MNIKLISTIAGISCAAWIETAAQTSVAPANAPLSSTSPAAVNSSLPAPETPVPVDKKSRRALFGAQPSVPLGEPLALDRGSAHNWSANNLSVTYGSTTARPSEKGASVLLFQSNDSRFVDQMEEDLNIMSVVLERNFRRSFGDESPTYHMGIPMLLSSGSKSVHALYVEGFGAILSFRVNFPLVAPATEKPASEPAGAGTDWDVARAELYGRPEYAEKANPPAVEYSEEQVELLKKTIFDSIKNGAHIRGLKPDEYISITVSGADSMPTAHRTGNDLKQKIENSLAVAEALGEPRTTFLTIRVKKSDVDSRVKETLAEDAFEKRASLNTYFGSVKTSRASGRSGYSGALGAQPGQAAPQYQQSGFSNRGP